MAAAVDGDLVFCVLNGSNAMSAAHRVLLAAVVGGLMWWCAHGRRPVLEV